MIWCSGWKLASAVSNAGGLGLIGAGSMYPDVLRTHIQKCRAATCKPFGVNIPLLYPDIQQLIAIILEEKVPVPEHGASKRILSNLYDSFKGKLKLSVFIVET